MRPLGGVNRRPDGVDCLFSTARFRGSDEFRRVVAAEVRRGVAQHHPQVLGSAPQVRAKGIDCKLYIRGVQHDLTSQTMHPDPLCY